MQLRILLGGAVAALLLCGAAQAASLAGNPPPEPRGGLPGVFSAQQQPPVILAQTNQALDEQLRQMNGRIEELNFQILQLQEQIRKMQEDTEFRFQELEDKKTDSSGSTAPKHTMTDPSGAGRSAADPAVGEPSADAQATARPPVAPSTGPALPGGQSPSIEELASAPDDLAGSQAGAPTSGEPGDSFGTITFDQSGNVVGGSVGDNTVVSRDPSAALPQQGTDTSDDTVVAALPPSNDPDDLYRSSYESILAGKYKSAEAGFRQHVERFPEDTRAPDSQFWLGESLLGQQKYREAAEVFLAASKKYPKAKKAPDMLFKLGVSLVGINQRDVGCATFAEVGKRYPSASPALKQRIAREQAQAKC